VAEEVVGLLQLMVLLQVAVQVSSGQMMMMMIKLLLLMAAKRMHWLLLLLAEVWTGHC